MLTDSQRARLRALVEADDIEAALSLIEGELAGVPSARLLFWPLRLRARERVEAVVRSL